MILVQLKNYLAQHKVANLFELTALVRSQPDAVRSMMQWMMQKGWVKQEVKTSKCGTKCQQCSPLLTEIYEWQGSS